MSDKKKSKSSSNDHFLEFITEFMTESDRAAVILGAAKLDLLLYQLLTKYFVPSPSSKDELLDGDSPLGTFSSKIHLAYRLGLIGADFTRALHMIRKIRNSFAHEVAECNLNSGAHRDRVKELIAPFQHLKVFKEGLKVEEKAHSLTGASAEFRVALGLNRNLH